MNFTKTILNGIQISEFLHGHMTILRKNLMTETLDVMGNYTQVKSFYRLDESYATETVAKNITKLYSYY